jgi:hypothetical protein
MTDPSAVRHHPARRGRAPRDGPDFGKASPVGLLVVVLLLVGTFALVWSMNRTSSGCPNRSTPNTPEPDQPSTRAPP